MTALMPSRPDDRRPMIEAIGVSKTFGPVCALDSVTLSAPRGSVLALLGHNGAGKTTLVNILTAMTPLSSGTARVAGFDVATDARKMREVIGLTGQFASVDERLSGRDNLVLIARLLGADRKAAKRRADTLLEVFDLTGAAKRLAKTYSGGMRRRLDLAVCLVGSPDVIFLDEPTTGLDPSSRINLWEIVETLVEQGTTVLLTTQYLDEADRLADTIAVLSGGSVVASGTAAQLKGQVGQRSVTVTLEPGHDPVAACLALERAGMAPAIGPDGVTITTPVGASKELAAVIRALDDDGIEAAELAFGEPTLDDVYLALAKKTARQPA
ncbi:ATP-binding cassette domain-containing protein [Amycolatopsis sp.]|uniref:ATP-binding cassette domain-containing protein n=1 Tax=Amycolatopsis sp. TaxID=37632 RepID=UPI002E084402|nr:ATP-binding cassette domain-containing protein [Amycolatopsis sp.]